ncbi:MAG: ferritin-like domain-containing protein [Armatimonadota bacterium]
MHTVIKNKSVEDQATQGAFAHYASTFKGHLQQEEPHPWDCGYHLTEKEKEAVTFSIQQFQLGEGSDGQRFKGFAAKLAQQTGDFSYPEAVGWFIAEEQRHSRLLGEFLKREGLPTLQHHWVDSCFRKLRRLSGAHVASTVLVTAELIAIPYYTALKAATDSPLLRSICDQILREEEIHIEFQVLSVATMLRTRSAFF